MIGGYVDKDYVFAVASIRLMEVKLFNKQTYDELISSKSSADIKKILKDKNWGDITDADFLQIIRNERVNLWNYIDELVPDRSVFNVFNIPNEYHNLKAAIKESILEDGYPNIYYGGTVSPYTDIKKCIENKNYNDLPGDMSFVANEAHDVFLRTGDGQLCDIIIDRACIEAIVKAGDESNEDFIKMYADLVSGIYNIKVCVRAAYTNKDREWVERAVADTNILDRNMLINTTTSGIDQLCNYLQNTDFSEGIPKIKKSLATFEKWCDDLIIDRIKSMQYETFGIGPVAAYILAKEQEIKNLRIIYTGITNGFSEDMIRERVRDCYV